MRASPCASHANSQSDATARFWLTAMHEVLLIGFTRDGCRHMQVRRPVPDIWSSGRIKYAQTHSKCRAGVEREPVQRLGRRVSPAGRGLEPHAPPVPHPRRDAATAGDTGACCSTREADPIAPAPVATAACTSPRNALMNLHLLKSAAVIACAAYTLNTTPPY